MSDDELFTTQLHVIDRFTSEVHRARWLLLTPIGRVVPPRGTLARSAAELHVRIRQVGRAVLRGLPAPLDRWLDTKPRERS